ncbi:MAG: YlbF family regulator [Roseburia sp.]|nr:YlbF family regulator [Roseburia sp.]MCM1097905.1 YlbF family regulator [Ruminococcus flavefaciens]
MFLKTLWSRRRNTEGGEPERKSGVIRAEGPGEGQGSGQGGNADEKGRAGQNKKQDGDRKGMNDLDQAVDNFIEAILASEIYRTYRAELEKVKQDPELKSQIDEFRKRNFQLQSSRDADYEQLDRFEKEYESFREEPLVADFLAGELDLCRKMQEISLRVVEALNFE